MAGEELEERIKQAVSAADKFSTLYYKYVVLFFKIKDRYTTYDKFSTLYLIRIINRSFFYFIKKYHYTFYYLFSVYSHFYLYFRHKLNSNLFKTRIYNP